MSYLVTTQMSINAIYDMFKAYDRGDNFSIEGLEVIMDYLTECNGNEPYKLDVIEICCSFTQYDDIYSFIEAYRHSSWFDENDYKDDYGDIDQSLISEYFALFVELSDGKIIVAE